MLAIALLSACTLGSLKDSARHIEIGRVLKIMKRVSKTGGVSLFEKRVALSEAVSPFKVPAGKIAFVSDRDGNDEIYLMNADGSNAVNLSNHPAIDRHPSWSPDGKSIAFASERDDNNFDIYVLGIETGRLSRLTTQGSNTCPAWSPSGRRIAFVSDRFGDKDVMVMNADGSRQIQLTIDVHSDDQPTWSPDSGSIAYVSDVGGQQDIYVIDSTDGAEIAQLTKGESDNSQPNWWKSESQDSLLFMSTRSGNPDIFVIDPATGAGLRQMTSDFSDEGQPAWSPDGAAIIFVSDRENGGEHNIYTISTDGENWGRLTPLGSNDREPNWK